MKTLLHPIAIISFLFTNSLIAQPDPITIQFVEAQPLWEHLTYDTTFYNVGIQPGINKYNVVEPRDAYRFDNDLFLRSFCLNYNGDIFGYVFERLNILTGSTEWQSFNTYYNNGIQDFYRNLNLTPEGNLEMLGIKRQGPYIDSIFGFWNAGGGSSNFVRKIFDYSTGQLKQTIAGKDSIGVIVPVYVNFFTIKHDSTYLAVHLAGENLMGDIYYKYIFQELDSAENLTGTNPLAEIYYETSDSAGYFSYGQPQFTEKLDDTTLIGLIFQDKLHPGLTKAQLIWMNISDIHQIHVTQRMNIEAYVPDDEITYNYFTFTVNNDKIYITQPYRISDTGYGCYLTCFDRYGHLLHYIPICSADSITYESINLIQNAKGLDYFVAFPSRTGRKGFDILRLDPGADEFTYISSLTSAKPDENFALQLEISKLYEDGLFIIGAYTKKDGPVLNTAVKFYCFNGADLGLDLNVSTKEIRPKSPEFSVFPNPASSLVTVSFREPFTGKIGLCNPLGQILNTNDIQACSQLDLDLKMYAVGIYYIICQDSQSGLKKIKAIFHHP